jgi:predicted nucleotidyltransferase
MVTKADLIARRDEIVTVSRRNGASNVRIFGSVARGDATASSDVDLVVRFDPDRSLMDHGMLIEELQELLGVKIDVVSEAALAPSDRVTHRLAQEAVPL